MQVGYKEKIFWFSVSFLVIIYEEIYVFSKEFYIWKQRNIMLNFCFVFFRFCTLDPFSTGIIRIFPAVFFQRSLRRKYHLRCACADQMYWLPATDNLYLRGSCNNNFTVFSIMLYILLSLLFLLIYRYKVFFFFLGGGLQC